MATVETTTTSVERALSILECVAEETNGLTNSEISRRLKIPKSSASYLLRTLEYRGYLRRSDDDGRYRLGLKVLGLGHRALSGMDLRRIALPTLMKLVEGTGLTAHLAILDHGRAVYIERAEHPGFIKMNTWVGRDLPVHSTSVGKAVLAYLPQQECDALLEKEGLTQQTDKTITSRSEFLEELKNVRTRGYALDDEENSLGVRCVAAPVFEAPGRARAAVGVSGTTVQLTRELLPQIAEQVCKAARSVSRQIGYQEAADST